jgi:hypothetical protein
MVVNDRIAKKKIEQKKNPRHGGGVIMVRCAALLVGEERDGR